MDAVLGDRTSNNTDVVLRDRTNSSMNAVLGDRTNSSTDVAGGISVIDVVRDQSDRG